MKRRELKAAMVARGCEDMEPLRVAIEESREVGLDAKDIHDAEKIMRDLEAEMQPMAFTDVPRAAVEKLQASSSREEIVADLAKLMKLSDKDGLKSEVLAEFHFHNFLFCQKNKFDAEKASAFLSIMRVLHTEAVVAKKLEEQLARALLEKLLLRHSRQLPPFSVGIYTEKEVDKIRDYVSRTFFRHYSMFAFMYEQRQDIILKVVEPRVVPKVPKAADLFKGYEIDPSTVPELQDLFETPAADEASDAGNATRAPANPREAAVMSVIDEVAKTHLGDLESRLSKLPI